MWLIYQNSAHLKMRLFLRFEHEILYILVSECKSNICCCHKSLSEGKVIVQAGAVESSEKARKWTLSLTYLVTQQVHTWKLKYSEP